MPVKKMTKGVAVHTESGERVQFYDSGKTMSYKTDEGANDNLPMVCIEDSRGNLKYIPSVNFERGYSVKSEPKEKEHKDLNAYVKVKRVEAETETEAESAQ